MTKKPLKIAYIITRSDNIGGAHIHIRDTALAMLSRGHRPKVFVGQEGPFTQELARVGVPFYSLKHMVRPILPWKDLQGVLELKQALGDWGPDIVSTHSSKAGLIGRVAARWLNIPALFTAHGWAFTEGVPERERRIYIMSERLTALLSKRVITVSEHDRQLALINRVASNKILRTVHNGMPPIDEHLVSDSSIHPPRLISVARFEEQKDHRTLFYALKQIKHLQWELDLVGDGPLLSKMQALVWELDLSDRVRFLGARRDVASLLSRSQLFILITNWEGFPRSILEAMRAGLPVIASDVGGVRESVDDGVTGYTVKRGDIDALAIRLSQLISDPGRRVNQGKAGYDKFQKEFTFELMLEKTWAIYMEVLKGNTT